MTYMTTIVRPADLAGFRKSVIRGGGHIVQSSPCGGGFAVTIATPQRERVSA